MNKNYIAGCNKETKFQMSFEEIIKKDILKFIELNPDCWIPDILYSYSWIDKVFLANIIRNIEKEKEKIFKRGCAEDIMNFNPFGDQK